jgi:hypothetical protein
MIDSRVFSQRVADGGPHINMRNLNLGDDEATAMAWAMMHEVCSFGIFPYYFEIDLSKSEAHPFEMHNQNTNDE